MDQDSPPPAGVAPDDLLLFTPVPLVRERADAWTAEVQRAFIAQLRRTGVVANAARSVGRSPRSAHALRARAGERSPFAIAWDLARLEAGQVAMDRAKELGTGKVTEPLYYRGRPHGHRVRHDNRLLFAVLRALDGQERREWAAAMTARRGPLRDDQARVAEDYLRTFGIVFRPTRNK